MKIEICLSIKLKQVLRTQYFKREFYNLPPWLVNNSRICPGQWVHCATYSAGQFQFAIDYKRTNSWTDLWITVIVIKNKISDFFNQWPWRSNAGPRIFLNLLASKISQEICWFQDLGCQFTRCVKQQKRCVKQQKTIV